MNGKLFRAWEDLGTLFTYAGQVWIDKVGLYVPGKIRYVRERTLAVRLSANERSFFVVVDGSHVILQV